MGMTAAKPGKRFPAIIMVSSELPEIINMCDNVCVIRAGKLVGKLGKDQMNQEEIMKYAAGGVE